MVSLRDGLNYRCGGRDCHTSDIGHWFAMTIFYVVRFYLHCAQPTSGLAVLAPTGLRNVGNVWKSRTTEEISIAEGAP